jgi:6-phosphogluconolactonase
MNQYTRLKKTARLSFVLVTLVSFGAIFSIPAKRLAAEQLLYLALQDPPRIETYSINRGTGALALQKTTELPAAPGPMAVSYKEDYLYAALRPKKGDKDGKPSVATLKISAKGELTLVGQWPLPAFATYLEVDHSGKHLLSAHYREGQVMVHKIVDGIATSERTDMHETAEKAHCIRGHGRGTHFYVPHTGPNKVFQFRFDAKQGKLSPQNVPFVVGPDEEHAYHQPRHLTFHPKLQLAYTANERGGGISKWSLQPFNGGLELEQTLSTLPPNFEGNSAAADIHITPDGRYAYVSNRDNTDRSARAGQDTIAAFELERKTGRMTLVGYYATEHIPRSFAIDKEGKYLYAAGQRSDKLAAYRINQATGALIRIATYTTAKVPIWVMCLQFENAEK